MAEKNYIIGQTLADILKPDNDKKENQEIFDKRSQLSYHKGNVDFLEDQINYIYNHYPEKSPDYREDDEIMVNDFDSKKEDDKKDLDKIDITLAELKTAQEKELDSCINLIKQIASEMNNS